MFSGLKKSFGGRTLPGTLLGELTALPQLEFE